MASFSPSTTGPACQNQRQQEEQPQKQFFQMDFRAFLQEPELLHEHEEALLQELERRAVELAPTPELIEDLDLDTSQILEDAIRLKDWQKAILRTRLRREEVTDFMSKHRVEDLIDRMKDAADSNSIASQPYTLDLGNLLKQIRLWKAKERAGLIEQLQGSKNKLRAVEEILGFSLSSSLSTASSNDKAYASMPPMAFPLDDANNASAVVIAKAVTDKEGSNQHRSPSPPASSQRQQQQHHDSSFSPSITNEAFRSRASASPPLPPSSTTIAATQEQPLPSPIPSTADYEAHSALRRLSKIKGEMQTSGYLTVFPEKLQEYDLNALHHVVDQTFHQYKEEGATLSTQVKEYQALIQSLDEAKQGLEQQIEVYTVSQIQLQTKLDLLTEEGQRLSEEKADIAQQIDQAIIEQKQFREQARVKAEGFEQLQNEQELLQGRLDADTSYSHLLQLEKDELIQTLKGEEAAHRQVCQERDNLHAKLMILQDEKQELQALLEQERKTFGESATRLRAQESELMMQREVLKLDKVKAEEEVQRAVERQSILEQQVINLDEEKTQIMAEIHQMEADVVKAIAFNVETDDQHPLNILPSSSLPPSGKRGSISGARHLTDALRSKLSSLAERQVDVESQLVVENRARAGLKRLETELKSQLSYLEATKDRLTEELRKEREKHEKTMEQNNVSQKVVIDLERQLQDGQVEEKQLEKRQVRLEEAISKLEQEKAVLQANYQDAEAHREELHTQETVLKKKVMTLERQLAEEKSHQTLHDDAYESLLTKLKTIQSEKASLQAELLDHQDLLRNLETQKERLTGMVDQLHKEKAALEANAEKDRSTIKELQAAKASLNDKIASLTENLASVKETLGTSEKKRKEMKTEQTDLHNRLNALEDEKTSLLRNEIRLEELLEQAKEETQGVERERGSVRQKVTELDAEKARLTTLLEVQGKRRVETETAGESWNGERANLRAQLAAEVETVRHLTDQMIDLQNRCNDLVHEKYEQQQQAEVLQGQKIDLEKHLRDLGGEKAMLEDRLNAYVRSMEEMRSKGNELDSRVQAFLAENVRLQHRLHVATSETERLENECQTFQATIRKMEEKKRLLEDKMEQGQTAYRGVEKDLADTAAEMKTLREEKLGLEQQLADVHTAKQDLLLQQQHLQEQLNKVGEEMEAVEEENRKLLQVKAELEAKLAENNGQLKELRQQSMAMEDRLQEEVCRSSELEMLQKETVSKLEKVDQQHAALQATCEEQQTKIVTLQGELEKLKQQGQQQGAGVDDPRQQVADLEAQLQHELKLKKMSSEQLLEVEGARTALQEKLIDSQREMASIQGQYQTLEGQNSRLQGELREKTDLVGDLTARQQALQDELNQMQQPQREAKPSSPTASSSLNREASSSSSSSSGAADAADIIEDPMVAMQKRLAEAEAAKGILERKLQNLEVDNNMKSNKRSNDKVGSSATKRGMENLVRDTERAKNESDAQKIAATFHLRVVQSQLKEERRLKVELQERVLKLEQALASRGGSGGSRSVLIGREEGSRS